MKYRLRKYSYSSLEDIYNALMPTPEPLKTNRVTASTRLENMIYSDLCKDTRNVQGRISGNPDADALLRDIWQTVFSPADRRTDEINLFPRTRVLHRPIIDGLRSNNSFSALKALCEGADHASMEAAIAFLSHMAAQLRELTDKGNGCGKRIEALERQTRRRDDLQRKLRSRCEQAQASLLSAADKRELYELAARTASKQEQVAWLEQQVQDALSASTSDILAGAAQAAQEAAEFYHNLTRCWGAAAGAGEKQEDVRNIAKRIEDNQSLIDITRELGRMKEVISSLRKNAFAYGRGEKYSLTQGRDINNILSGELALLATRGTTPLFLRRYNAKSLRQYAKRDPIRKGHGDIIVCLDESSSTKGKNAAWGKALALALQDLCALFSRKFALVHFSSSNEIKTDVFLPGKYDARQLLDAAEHFFDGNTDFEAPISEAIRLVENGGFEDADVVFITDGICSVSDAFVQKLHSIQSDKHFTILGILLDAASTSGFSLELFCERVMRLSQMQLEDAGGEIISSFFG